MRALGAVLVLWGAGWFCWRQRQEGLLLIRVGQAVLAELAVLRYQICVCRRSLPELCTEILTEGLGAEYLWGPLGRYLLEADGLTVTGCWAKAAGRLPPPLEEYIAPLGPLLPAGGERLAAAIEETREELTGFLRTERMRQAERGRVTAAVCLCGACLVILVLI